MIYATGTFNKDNCYYKMHKPFPPYDSITYIGYTEKQMKKKYREDCNLKYKRIEWIIL